MCGGGYGNAAHMYRLVWAFTGHLSKYWSILSFKVGFFHSFHLGVEISVSIRLKMVYTSIF